MPNDKLKPCPFCGGRARLSGPIQGVYEIFCDADYDEDTGESDCDALPCISGATKNGIIAAWNRRADAR